MAKIHVVMDSGELVETIEAGPDGRFSEEDVREAFDRAVRIERMERQTRSS